MLEMSGPVIVLVGILVLAVLARLIAWLLSHGSNPHGAVGDFLRALVNRGDAEARVHMVGDWDETARAYAQGMGRMLAAPRQRRAFHLKSATIEGDRGTVMVEVPMLPGMEALVGERAMTVPHTVVLSDGRWRVDLHATERDLRDDPLHRLVFVAEDESSDEWWGGEEPDADDSHTHSQEPSRGRLE